MKIKIINIMNKIANGEEAPKKIKYDMKTYFYDETCQDYTDYDRTYGLFSDLLDKQYGIFSCLNDEVEIIEEKKKMPEEIECYHQYDECVIKDKFYQDQKGSLADEIIIDKINEIIDYLKSKGEQ